MIDRESIARWNEMAKRVTESFPQRLTAAAIRKILDDIDRLPPTPDGDAEAALIARCYHSKLGDVVMAFVERVVIPADFAERRRRAGDCAASPRDYDCGCPVPDADGVPTCRERPGCRFAGLRKPNRSDSHGPDGARHGAKLREFRKILGEHEASAPETLAQAIALMEKRTEMARRRCERRAARIGFCAGQSSEKPRDADASGST